MISKEHKKHSQIARPSYGIFNRNEWAIVGSADHVIRELAYAVIKELSPLYKCAYVGSGDENNADITSGKLAAGSITEYNNHGNYHQFHFNKSFNRFGFRQLFLDADLVLVNGNFQQTKAQVIVVDNNTQTLLEQVLPNLTNVQLILITDHAMDSFDFVKQEIPNWKELPVYRLSEMNKITAFFQQQLEHARPVMKGLVLAGGKSIRMGSDKGSISWHGKEQRYYMADLLQNFCEEVYISCRHDQQDIIDTNYKKIEDSFTELGPYGAILSAFREQPDCAWLVTACDMPFLDASALKYLTEQRKPSAMATTFESPQGGFPEPLITIWEPRSYPILLSMLSQGYTCPRKALENNDVCVLKPPHAGALINVNTPEEKETAKNILNDATQD